MSDKVTAPFVNCTSVWEVWSVSNKVNITPFESGVMFLNVALSFTSWASPEGLKASESLNLTCILETSISNCADNVLATPETPALAL